MVTMKEKYEIILQHFREGKSVHQISKDLGLHRKTVTRYIERHHQMQQKKSSKPDSEPLDLASLNQKPVYDSRKRGKRRLTEKIRFRIDELLKLNSERRSQGLHKQQLKKCDIYELLIQEGRSIGYTSVCNYIRMMDQKTSEAFIRQHYSPCSQCEFDWGEVKLTISGESRRVQLAVFTSAYSNYRFSGLFWRQDTQSFQQSHVDFFAHCGGVFHQMVYDNMRVAISSFTGKTEKQPTESFLSLAMFYRFSYRFCNVRKGNEKGHVERSVEYVRRKAFSLEVSYDSLEQANSHLLVVCKELNTKTGQGQQQSIFEKYQIEQPLLYPVTGRFDCSQIKRAKVDKYSCIQLGNNHYSVPDHLVGKNVSVRLYADKLDVYYQDRYQCSHVRIAGRGGWKIQLEHYLKTLLTKPGALNGSIALQQADKSLRNLYADYFIHIPVDFIRLVEYLKKSRQTIDHLLEAVETTKQHSPHDVTADKIIIVSQNMLQKGNAPVHNGDIETCASAQLQEISELFNRKNH